MKIGINKSGPAVIGGVGGSGTRVMAALINELGFYIGNDLNIANDNLWFTLLFTSRPSWYSPKANSEFAKALRLFEKTMTGTLTPGRDEINLITRSAIDAGLHGYIYVRPDRGYLPVRSLIRLLPPLRRIITMGWMFGRAATILRSNRVDLSKYTNWGWKEPASYIYLQHLNTYFGDRVKYIHVIRHGLDMAYSHNQGHLVRWGDIFGVEVPSEKKFLPKASLDYWIKANKATIDLGKLLLGDRFLVINFDELCISPQRQIDQLLDFLNIDTSNIDITKLTNLFRTPSSIGRYKKQNLDIFSKADFDAVQKLGFIVDM